MAPIFDTTLVSVNPVLDTAIQKKYKLETVPKSGRFARILMLNPETYKN
jgi:hypothetical protein